MSEKTPIGGFYRLVGGAAADRSAVFEPEALINTALERAGCDLTLDATSRAGLDSLCAALNQQARRFNFRGRKFIQTALVEVLVKRARLEGHAFIDPVAKPPKAPIFIVAPFRSGTTLLHRLLALDPQFRAPEPWESAQAQNLSDDPDSDPAPMERSHRIARVDAYFRNVERLSPTLLSLHPTGATQAEECFALLEPSLQSASFLFWAPIAPYLDWLGRRNAQDRLSAYLTYSRYLQRLEPPAPGATWLLKSPVHLWGLDALSATFPDARVIFLHRDWSATARSFSALLAAHWKIYLRKVDPTEANHFARAILEQGAAQAVVARDAVDRDRLFDLSFERLLNAPLETVSALYQRLGLVLTPATKRSMQDWLDLHHGPNRPTALAPVLTGCDATAPAAFDGYRNSSGPFI